MIPETQPTPAPHIPVMLPEVLQALQPADRETYIDGTFGAGGYTSAILDAAECSVIAIDRDETAIAAGEDMVARYAGRLRLSHGNFADAAGMTREAVDGIVLDLGVSSMQIDQAERGFSFRFDGPLDMRMDRAAVTLTAADIVNRYDEGEIADILYRFGDERHSRRIARAIVAARASKPFETTGELANTIRSVLPRKHGERIDPATRSFQALRIFVNAELDALENLLGSAEMLLREGGRLVVVSFHSLEDAIVKRFLMDRAGRRAGGSRHLPESAGVDRAPTFALQTGRAIAASDAESRINPRARSAKLRAATRTSAPAAAAQKDFHSSQSLRGETQ